MSDDLPVIDLREGPREVKLVRTQDGRAVEYPTLVRLSHADGRLEIAFNCTDDDPWATMTERDQPLYDEEVCEVFIAAGAADPHKYYEFEVNPLGALWDGWIDSPNLGREGMTGHPEWDCPGIQWEALRTDTGWIGRFSIPLAELGSGEEWRLNLYRIKRPKGREVEWQAWSPTLRDPAEYHVPARMGRLLL